MESNFEPHHSSSRKRQSAKELATLQGAGKAAKLCSVPARSCGIRSEFGRVSTPRESGTARCCASPDGVTPVRRQRLRYHAPFRLSWSPHDRVVQRYRSARLGTHWPPGQDPCECRAWERAEGNRNLEIGRILKTENKKPKLDPRSFILGFLFLV